MPIATSELPQSVTRPHTMRIAAVQWREQPERTALEALHAAIAAEYGALEAEMARTLEMTGWSMTALRARYPRTAAPA